MSGGEKRLINIAKCLINDTIQIIFLDEPSAFLDFHQKQKLAMVLLEKSLSQKIIIFSSHDLDFINRCATKIMDLNNQKFLIYTPREFSSSFSFRESSPEMAISGSNCS